MGTNIYSWLVGPDSGTHKANKITDSKEYAEYQEQFNSKKESTLFDFLFYGSEKED